MPIADIPDFSRARAEPFQFQVDGDVFACSPVLPAGGTRTLLALSAATEANDPRGIIQALGDFMDIVMLPDSAETFAERLRDPVRPIDDEQMNAIAVWLVEKYGQRPTMPPAPSGLGRQTDGSSSTDGAVPAVV